MHIKKENKKQAHTNPYMVTAQNEKKKKKKLKYAKLPLVKPK